LLTGVTGGVGAITAITGARIVDRIITDRLQKRKVDAKFAEMKNQLETDEAGRDNFLKEFFAEVSVTQQNRIGDFSIAKEGLLRKYSFDFESFTNSNPDLLAGYEDNEREEVMRALGALQEIDNINHNRETELSERVSDWIKERKTPGIASSYAYAEKVASGFNKFMVKGGENIYERSVSVAMLGGAAIAARELPFVRESLLALAGWKAGDFAGRMIWGTEKPELGKIDDVDTANDILLTLEEVMKNNRTSDKQKRLLVKAATATAFASAPFIANQIMEHWPQGNETKPPVAITPEAPPVAPQVNPLEEAINEMKNVHGEKSPHLWGLIEAKTDAMMDHLKSNPDVVAIADSEGRMTHIIDNIKDQIAKNPQEFGLAKNFNINRMTPADLESISQNPHFNELFTNIFKEGSFAQQAEALSGEALRNIETSNAYYHDVATHLDGAKLDQATYDAIDRMREQGLPAEEAAQMIQQSNGTTLNHAVETATAIPVPEPQAIGADITADTPTSENSSIDLQNITENSDTTPEEATLSTFSENFQDDKTKHDWLNTLESMKDNNKHAITKSLDSIFHKLGLTENYSDPNSAIFSIKNANCDKGILSFEVPPPIDHQLADQTDTFHFSYDPAKHEMTGYVADESIVLKNIKNVDASIKTVFNNLMEKVK
jgi:hypothetical protein